MKQLLSHRSRSTGRRLAFLLSALLLMASAACDGGCGSGSKTMPDSASARVENMASHLPKTTQASFIVGDLQGMRQSLSTARSTLGDAMPMADLIEQQAQNELGIDIFDEESWKKSGIAADGGMSVSAVGTRPVLLTYINDAQKFEKSLTDQLKNSMGIEGVAKSATEADTKVKVLGTGDASVAWAYDGKLVAVVFPSDDSIKDFGSSEDVKDAAKLAARLVSLDAKTSLAKQQGFQRFQKALANDDAMAVYINTNTLLNESRMKRLDGPTNARQKATAEWMKNNIDAFGLSLGVKDNTMLIRGWASLPDKALKTAREIMTAADKSPISNFATANTLLGLRTSLDMSKLWNFYKQEVLSEEDRAKLDADMARASAQTDLNFESDIITKLTGNIGVILYGADPARLEQAGGNLVAAVMARPLQTLAVLIPVQFKDKKSVEKVVEALIKSTGGATVRTPLRDGVEVLKVQNITDSPGQVFVKDNLLVYATGTFSDDSVVDYINGTRDDEKLGDNKALNLGKDFANQESYNGLYLNFVRARTHLGAQVARAFPPAVEILERFEEAALTAEVGDQGAYLNLAIDLTPQAEKPATQPNK